MKFFKVYYRFPNDSPNHGDLFVRIQAEDADDAKRKFNADHQDEPEWKAIVLRVLECH